MKCFIFAMGLIVSITCSGQIDSILDETLDKIEYEYLNSNLDTEKYSFDFTNKKVAFFSSPGGTILRSKADFFDYENGKVDGYKVFDIVIFTEKQKAKHGFDAAVVYMSKNSQPRISNKLKRLVRKETKHNNAYSK